MNEFLALACFFAIPGLIIFLHLKSLHSEMDLRCRAGIHNFHEEYRTDETLRVCNRCGLICKTWP